MHRPCAKLFDETLDKNLYLFLSNCILLTEIILSESKAHFIQQWMKQPLAKDLSCPLVPLLELRMNCVARGLGMR